MDGLGTNGQKIKKSFKTDLHMQNDFFAHIEHEQDIFSIFSGIILYHREISQVSKWRQKSVIGEICYNWEQKE